MAALVILLPTLAPGDSCPELEVRLAEEKKQLQNLQTLNEELNKRFDEQLSADLTVQSEGLWDRLHHNEAVKIAYAKRKLAQSLAAKTQEVEALQREFCPHCRTKNFCQFCPSDASCGEAERMPQSKKKP